MKQKPPRGTSDYYKLYKLRSLITELNKILQREAHNSQVQSVDECTVNLKGEVL